MTAEQQVAEVVREFTGEKESEPAPREEPEQEAASDKEGERIPRKENASGRNVGEFDERVIQNARDAAGKIVAVLDGESEITASGGERGIKIEIDGGEAGIIIGRRGQTLDAIQYLVTRIVSHQEGRPIRINIDAGGYRRRRKESLEGLAVRMAEKAQMVGRAVAVGPFNSPERRIVHMALKGREGISTISRGRGDLKKVIISPRG
jgi:spoIIIJ-associated protein